MVGTLCLEFVTDTTGSRKSWSNLEGLHSKPGLDPKEEGRSVRRIPVRKVYMSPTELRVA